MMPAATTTVRGCWNAVVSVLAQSGVRAAFGLPADDLDLLAAVADSDIDLTVCRDQRNAAFMATGYAIASGRPGVLLTGKGPALTNTVTGLLEAQYSAAPVLLISAGTAVEHRGGGAFQELDQLSVVAPLTKWAARVDHPDRLVPMLRRAVLAATSGTPGPVYLEVPDHLLTDEIPLTVDTTVVERPATVTVAADSAASSSLRRARRPLLLVGGGMRHRNANRLVETFAETYGAAVACTASGRGTVDESCDLFVGLSGLYLPPQAAPLLAEVDCVIALGSRLEETATYDWPASFGRETPVVQVNVEATEFATGFAGPKILADGGALLAAWLATAEPGSRTAWTDRVREVHQQLRTDHADELARLRKAPDLHVAEVLTTVDEVVPADRILVQENGLQDMWSYRFPFYACDGTGSSVVPSEQTALGFGAAAAIGVRHAAGGRPVVALVGDGAFDLAAADMPTAVNCGGLLYVVLRNGGYGWLQSQLDGRSDPVPGFTFVDPAARERRGPELAGLRQFTVEDTAQLSEVVGRAWAYCAEGGVAVLNVPVRMDDALFGSDVAGGDFPVVSTAAGAASVGRD
ncbi:acetolactate synthase-1/2/3 large subunit [Prauserella aidingensis]|nr:acetolactate synthase-1/2/3 large subunit [Prauserella aidingensis]